MINFLNLHFQIIGNVKKGVWIDQIKQATKEAHSLSKITPSTTPAPPPSSILSPGHNSHNVLSLKNHLFEVLKFQGRLIDR